MGLFGSINKSISSVDLPKAVKTFSANNGGEILKFTKALESDNFKHKQIILTVYDPNDFYKKAKEGIGQKMSNMMTWGASVFSGDGYDSLENSQALKDASQGIVDMASVNILYTIHLPLMNAFQEQNAHSYSEDTGALGSTANGASDLSSSASSGIIEAYGRFGDFGGNLDNMAFAPPLPQVDPLKWQNFKGSSLRTFQFIFKISPRNIDEASNMMRIFWLLKRSSYPKKEAGGVLLIPPARVGIQFSNPLLHKLIAPGICVIDGISMVYENGDDIAVTLDGVPKKIEFTLSLKEFRQKYQDDWNFESASL